MPHEVRVEATQNALHNETFIPESLQVSGHSRCQNCFSVPRAANGKLVQQQAAKADKIHWCLSLQTTANQSQTVYC